jgi:nucleolar protein 6
MPAAPKKTAAKVVPATTTIKKPTATTATQTIASKTTLKKAAPAEPSQPEGPDKAAIAAFTKKYFKPTGANVQTKNTDPLIDLYNFDPQHFPFHKDNGSFFELVLVSPQDNTVSEKNERLAFISLLQLHAKWINFTPDYKGASRVKCTITKNEIIPTYAELKSFYSGVTFQREWKRVGASFDARIKQHQEETKKAALVLKEAEKRKLAQQEDEEIALLIKRQKISTRINSKAEEKLVRLGVDSDDDDSSDSDSSDDDEMGDYDYDAMDDTNGEEEDKKVEIKMARKRAKLDLNVDSRTGDKAPARDEAGNTSKVKRFIVFVGNLDYKTRKSHLYKLFNKCDVIDVRISTDKLTKQPKGYAFVELSNAQDLHHALGYDQHSLRGRPINVELTAGGGGNTKARRAKIETKRKQIAQEKLFRFGAGDDKQ